MLKKANSLMKKIPLAAQKWQIALLAKNAGESPYLSSAIQA
jgi:hypothetical protein